MFHLDLANVAKVSLSQGRFRRDGGESGKKAQGKSETQNEGEDDDGGGEEEEEGKEVVVVSVFGSSFWQGKTPGYKRAFQLVMDAYGTVQLYQGRGSGGKEEEGEGEETEEESKNLGGKLEGFLNEDESVLFLHLEDFAYDAASCLECLQTLHQAAIKESGILSVWASIHSLSCRWLLLLFSLSHVLILSEPGSSLDTSYISLFRALDAVRLDVLSTLSKILGTIEGLPRGWVDHGRLCSPRLLFLFEGESDTPPQKRDLVSPLPGSSEVPTIKERKDLLQHEIYQIFRKCRIITNISANSLFAVPAADDFIFLFDRAAQNTTTGGGSAAYTYLEILQESRNFLQNNASCYNGYKIGSRPPPLRSFFRATPTILTYADTVFYFRRFLSQHLAVAKERGFDDDFRRVSGYKHFFIRPQLSQWARAYEKLHSFLIQEPQGSKRIMDAYLQMDRFIQVNTEYLEMQCADLFPKIFAAYQRTLPEYYTAQQHQHRLNYAISLFLNLSRGPGVVPWLKKLAQKCEKYWKNGRQQCETLSLMGHVCSQPMHQVRRKDHLEIVPLPEDMDPELPELCHTSANKLIGYCNCGKRQGSREEPFTVRQANYEWYRKTGRDCCDKLEAYRFPVFMGQEEDNAMATGVSKEEEGISLQDMIVLLQRKKESLKGNEGLIESGEEVFEAELRQEESEEGDEEESVEDEEDEEPEEVEELPLEKQIKREGGALVKRHSSTVEYLPGMYHSQCPQGLLPLFPSWSLLCLGASSIYSHSHGVSQHGFLGGANVLLPWDVKVKAEKGVTYKPPSRLMRERRRRDRDYGASSRRREILVSSHLPQGTATTASQEEFSVKVFFGFEYECRKGHRFMGNGQDNVLYAQNMGQQVQKQLAGKVAAGDVPLYLHCPCKENKENKQIAQLIRVHVVTPKAPVFVTLHPKIQPGPGAPIFTPLPPPEEDSEETSIKLSPSTYWILRVPFAYVGDVVYVPPSSAEQISRYNGKLLKGVINVVSMSNEETERWKLLN